MKKAAVSAALIALLTGIGLPFVSPRSVQAHEHAWHSYHWHRNEPVVVLPRNGISIAVGGFSFFYSDGMYYKPCPGGYVIVPAPVGACVPTLPPACQTVVLNGSKYNYYDGVYYQQVPDGYTVVPVGLAKTIPVKAASVPEKEEGTTLVVNIPNKNGSYTQVTLQLAANGMYIGPQGEVYPIKPDMEQLKTMYGK